MILESRFRFVNRFRPSGLRKTLNQHPFTGHFTLRTRRFEGTQLYGQWGSSIALQTPLIARNCPDCQLLLPPSKPSPLQACISHKARRACSRHAAGSLTQHPGTALESIWPRIRVSSLAGKPTLQTWIQVQAFGSRP